MSLQRRRMMMANSVTPNTPPVVLVNTEYHASEAGVAKSVTCSSSAYRVLVAAAKGDHSSEGSYTNGKSNQLNTLCSTSASSASSYPTLSYNSSTRVVTLGPNYYRWFTVVEMYEELPYYYCSGIYQWGALSKSFTIENGLNHITYAFRGINGYYWTAGGSGTISTSADASISLSGEATVTYTASTRVLKISGGGYSYLGTCIVCAYY